MRKGLIVLLSIVLFVMLYETIGYSIRGLNGALLIGENNAYFIGNYLLALTYFAGAVLCIIGLILLFCYKRRKAS